MSADSQACVDWMLAALAATGKFGDKIFEVYDPGVLQSIAKKLNPPVCGVVYEGLISSSGEADQGTTSFIHVSVIVLAESRERSVRQTADTTSIASILDVVRSKVLRQLSPTNHAWVFQMEIPMDLGDKGLVYYQKWKTQVVL